MIRVAIVEDNDTLRRSLEVLINRSGDMKCVACLSNLLNVVSELGKAHPDVVLMDIGLPNISGIEGVRTIKNSFLSPQILMLLCLKMRKKFLMPFAPEHRATF